MESLRSGVLLLPLFAIVVLGVQRMPNRHYDPAAISSALRDQGKTPEIVDPKENLKDLEVPPWPLDLVTEPVQKKAKARQNPKKYQPPTKSTFAAPTTATATTVEVSSTATTSSTEVTSH